MSYGIEKGVAERPADMVSTSNDVNDNIGPQSVAAPVVDPALSPAPSAPAGKAFTPSGVLEPAMAADSAVQAKKPDGAALPRSAAA